jgi:hypothetical protein
MRSSGSKTEKKRSRNISAVAIQKELIEISRRLKEFYADWESKKFEQEDLLSRLEKEHVEDTPEE